MVGAGRKVEERVKNRERIWEMRSRHGAMTNCGAFCSRLKRR
jgi:hypothetical protein